MSEIADELERMAEEFGRSADTLEDKRSGLKHAAAGFMLDGEQTAYASAARRLRERAAEIRAQRSGPTATDRPRFMARGQWWACRNASPGRVYDLVVDDNDGELCAYFEGVDGERWTKETRIVTSSPSWTYLGNGERPAT